MCKRTNLIHTNETTTVRAGGKIYNEIGGRDRVFKASQRVGWACALVRHRRQQSCGKSASGRFTMTPDRRFPILQITSTGSKSFFLLTPYVSTKIERDSTTQVSVGELGRGLAAIGTWLEEIVRMQPLKKGRRTNPREVYVAVGRPIDLQETIP